MAERRSDALHDGGRLIDPAPPSPPGLRMIAAHRGQTPRVPSQAARRPPRVAVLSSAHDCRDARLERWARAFEAAGSRVTVRAVPPGRAGGGRPLARLAARSTRSLRLVIAGTVRRYDVVVLLDPDLAIAAGAVRRLLGLVVADVHEDYHQVVVDRVWARGRAGGPARVAGRMLSRVASEAAGRADVTVVADEHLPPAMARRRLVVRNRPGRMELPRSTDREESPRAVYIGDVRPSRGLITMVQAVLASPPWQLDIVGPISASDRAWVAQQLAGSVRVRVHGRLDLQRSWELALGAWTGLALLDDTPAFHAAMPTKLYEYMACGLPVLGSPLPRIAALIETSGAGRTATGPHEVAAVLRKWHENPNLVDAHARAAQRWATANLAVTNPFEEAAATVLDILRGRLQ